MKFRCLICKQWITSMYVLERHWETDHPTAPRIIRKRMRQECARKVVSPLENTTTFRDSTGNAPVTTLDITTQR